MVSRVITTCVYGIDVIEIQVETDMADGLPAFNVVGYLSASAKEAADRVRTAIRNQKIAIPVKKITVNLSPADIRKEGARYDLPIAVSLLDAMGLLGEGRQKLKDTIIAGELGLDGSVRRVSGILPTVIYAKEHGYKRCIVPADNLAEGEVIDGIDCIGIASLGDVLEMLRDSGCRITNERGLQKQITISEPHLDFSDIKGQRVVRRAAEVAVAGMHNLLMLGPPGSGKTMIAKRLPTLFPNLSWKECIDISKIYSVTGNLSGEEPIITKRPFRVPHHTVTATALIGGGKYPVPGEVSMAHEGVLFLDELTEYSKYVLECLRQPMEDGEVQISRVHGTYIYPARFMLVAAMNPCPCGCYPDRARCSCSPGQISAYLKKISQPLLDRIDICVETPSNTYVDLKERAKGESSDTIRKRVEAAVKIQEHRFAGMDVHFNSRMSSKMVEEYCVLSKDDERYLGEVFERLSLSGRAYHKILKVARTLADLEGSEQIQKRHLSEAILYRSIDKKYWIH